MKNTEILTALLKHMEWADSVVWRSVINCPGSDNDDKIKEILLHYHTTQWAFLQTWKEQSSTIPDVSSLADLTSILYRVIQYYEELSRFRSGISTMDLDRKIIVPWIDIVRDRLGKEPGTISLTETMLQVSVHSSHHRGQVNKRLREIGGKPPIVDFIAWGWMGKPEAQWSNISSH